MHITRSSLTRFCQDVDKICTYRSLFYRGTLSTPEVGDVIALMENDNPLLVEITQIEGDQYTGQVLATLNTRVMKTGMVLTGSYNGKTTEWIYAEGDEMMMFSDFRESYYDLIASTPFFRRPGLMKQLRSNNASLDIVLSSVTGEKMLSKTCTLKDVLTWARTKGEILHLLTLLFNTGAFMYIASHDHLLIPTVISGACAIYTTYVWHKDMRLQKRMQADFDTQWTEHKKEYARINDVIVRYGLSPSRVEALKKWNHRIFTFLSEFVNYPDMALPKGWYCHLDMLIKAIDLNEAEAKQLDALDAVFIDINQLINDLDAYQKHTYN